MKIYRVLIETGAGQVPAFRTRFETYREAREAADKLNPGLSPVVHSVRFPVPTTPAQREALKGLWRRQNDGYGLPWRAFRASVQPEIGSRAVMVPWCNMWIGIEPDGYCHS